MNQKIADVKDFQIVFEKLEEARLQQDASFTLEMEAVTETAEAVAYFKEFQESLTESTTYTFTRS